VAKLDDQLTALATMSPAQLRAEWERVHREPAPALTADLLMRALAYRLQERMQGGLPAPARTAISQLVRQLDRGSGIVPDRSIAPKAGTRLVREWRGGRHHVLVLDQGFQYQGRQYRSLSHIARDITGAAWSGPRFFGLRVRSDSKTIRAHG
jgi:hypothetical protein